MQAQAAEASGYAGQLRCLLERTGAQRLFKSFLARNELVAPAFA
jgi:hypothetical protein